MDSAARDDDGEGDLGGDFLGFPDCPLLSVFVLRRLESVDVVVRDVEEDLNRGWCEERREKEERHTCCLKLLSRLTLVCRRRIPSI